MNKYATYEVEDFVHDADFINWVKFPNEKSVKYWAEFIDAYPEKKKTILRARQIISQLSEASKVTIDKNDATEIWSNLQQQIAKKESQKILPLVWIRWMAAAAILFIVGLFFWKEYSISKTSTAYHVLLRNSGASLQEVVNTSGKPMIVSLPDSSQITLQKDSRVSYEIDFNGPERQVFLSGEAFFKVTKNPKKPFIVYANELVTKVLGTSFTISAFENEKQIHVSVRTGKVSVFKNKNQETQEADMQTVILVPNQQVTFSREQGTLKRALVPNPQIVVPLSELSSFSFVNAPLPTIFTALEKVYGVDIQFDAAALSNCSLTTALGQETLFERLDIICEAIGATYQVEDTKIIISTKGCN